MSSRPTAPMSLRIELFPADLDRTIAFYVDILDFELVADRRGDAHPYAAFVRGEVRIGTAESWATVEPGTRELPAGTEIVLEVDDVVAEEARVRATGWPIDEPLTRAPWGLTHFRIHDPDGYHLRITSRD
jgi:lactoylglutathione lyase